jgi:hypothetical protein
VIVVIGIAFADAAVSCGLGGGEPRSNDTGEARKDADAQRVACERSGHRRSDRKM